MTDRCILCGGVMDKREGEDGPVWVHREECSATAAEKEMP